MVANVDCASSSCCLALAALHVYAIKATFPPRKSPAVHVCFQVTAPREGDELPPLPEPEGSLLKNHLKQVTLPRCRVQ